MSGGMVRICDEMPIPILLLDRNLNVIGTNRSFTELTGLRDSDLSGKSLFYFLGPSYGKKIKSTIKDGAREFTFDDIVELPDVAPGKWFHMVLKPMNGKFVVSFTEITSVVSAHRTLKLRNNELEAIYSFVNSIGGTLELEEIYEIAYRELSRIIPAMDAFMIALVDYEEKTIYLEYTAGPSGKFDKRKAPLDEKASLTGWVAFHGMELYIRDMKNDHLPSNFRVIGEFMNSWLGIPLKYRGEILGVMSVQSRKENAFTEYDIKLLRLIAAHLAMVIYNARIYGKLKESEEKYRTLVNTSLVAIVTVDMNYTITFVNDALVKMLGYKKEELLGKKVFEFIPEDQHEKIRLRFKRRKMGFSDTYETELRKKGGERVPVLIYASPLKDRDGRITGVLATITDVSPLKQLEEELRESRALKELLLHTVAHDLKTHLSVVLGYVELLREEYDEEYIASIEETVKDAVNLIESIRSLSKLDAESLTRARERFTLRSVISAALSVVKKKYPNKIVRVDIGEVEICGYPDLMREVFSNLLINAFKYGASRVDIKSEITGGFVRVSVSDDGPGIPDERKEEIFSPYVSLSRSGSGIGLYIVQKVVTLHGGRVWVEDNRDGGSVFVMEIPLCP